MPTFNIPTQTITFSGQSGGQKADPNLFNPVFQADRQIGAAIGSAADKSSQVIEEHLVKKQQARDNADINNALIKFDEGTNELHLRQESSNTPEQFDKLESEFDEFSKPFKEKLLNEVKSPQAKQRLSIELDRASSRGKLFSRITSQKKERDYLEASHKAARQRAIENGELESANESTNQAFEDGLLTAPERNVELVENEQQSNFFNARDIIEQDFRDKDKALKEFTQTRANKERLTRFAADKEKQFNDQRDKVLEGHLNSEMNNPEFDLDRIESLITENQAIGYDQAKGESFRKFFRTKDKNRRNESFKPDSFRSAKGAAIVKSIERDYRLKKITRAQAHSLSIAVLDEFSEEIDGGAISGAFTLFDKIVSDIKTNTESLRSESDKILESFPLGFFGESIEGAETKRELEQARVKQIAEIESAPPEQQQKLREAFNKAEEERLQFFTKVNNDIDLWISLNPNASVPELQEQIKKLTEVPLKKEAFRQSTLHKFIGEKILPLITLPGIR